MAFGGTATATAYGIEVTIRIAGCAPRARHRGSLAPTLAAALGALGPTGWIGDRRDRALEYLRTCAYLAKAHAARRPSVWPTPGVSAPELSNDVEAVLRTCGTRVSPLARAALSMPPHVSHGLASKPAA